MMLIYLLSKVRSPKKLLILQDNRGRHLEVASLAAHYDRSKKMEIISAVAIGIVLAAIIGVIWESVEDKDI